MTADRLTTLETQLTHQQHLLDELNAVVTRQAAEIDKLTRRVAMLTQHAAEQIADSPANQKPPHY